MIELDTRAWRLLQALQEDGRRPLKVLAEATGLSVPATLERLRRLEEAGVIRGVHADIEPRLAGYAVQAVIGINLPQSSKPALLDHLRGSWRVLECRHVSGNDAYLIDVVATDLQDLESFLFELSAFGETRTSIVFSTPIERRGLVPPQTERPR
jgi:Lrp/AsnC family leucine-responsive transcriptional regulator